MQPSTGAMHHVLVLVLASAFAPKPEAPPPNPPNPPPDDDGVLAKDPNAEVFVA